jgi:KEOPS complex subunit Cgi121
MAQHQSYEFRSAVITVSDRNALLATIREIAQIHHTHIVCFDAEKMAGLQHAESAIRHAQHSISNGSAISNSFEMEALLYTAGSRQCSIAASFGIHEGKNLLFICCCPSKSDAWNALVRHMDFVNETWDEPVPEKTNRLMALFGITPEEIDAAGVDHVTALVLERVALLEVSK